MTKDGVENIMTKAAILVLADGSTYEGYAFGAETDAIGEAVFNTSMAGYQEMLTDPSYAGHAGVEDRLTDGNRLCPEGIALIS